MRTIQQWLMEYGESHKNETNKTIHWICVPAIFFSIAGLLYCIKLPLPITNTQYANAAMVMIVLVTFYYMMLSGTIWIGMLLFGLICLCLCYVAETFIPLPLWLTSIILFVSAWIGQFYGHKIEGKKPSFLKDLQFLLIGPMWLMSFIYQRLGIRI